jgi:hypothetical protein
VTAAHQRPPIIKRLFATGIATKRTDKGMPPEKPYGMKVAATREKP